MDSNNQHTIYFKAIITWLWFMPIAFINGVLREFTYKPFTGELAAHQISTIMASAAFFALAYFRLHHYLRTTSRSNLFLIGSVWVVATVVFEFLSGRFISGSTWERLLYDYNITEGRIWILLLVTMLLTPLVIKTIVGGNGTKYQYSR